MISSSLQGVASQNFRWDGYPASPWGSFLAQVAASPCTSWGVCLGEALLNPALFSLSQDCSLFYSKRVCLPCVQENIGAFPQEIQRDVEKRKAASKRHSSHS